MSKVGECDLVLWPLECFLQANKFLKVPWVALNAMHLQAAFYKHLTGKVVSYLAQWHLVQHLIVGQVVCCI